MLCSRNSSTRSKHGSTTVHLNVYDLTSMNGYAYWFGLGVYHSGVQVHGVEYAFGAHEYPTTGIFEAEPKQCEGFTFRKSILIGWTEMSAIEVRRMMMDLAEVYKGNAYNLISKNCNHFCNDACVRLTGNSIPSWINRLARIGVLCKCIIPANLNLNKVGQQTRIEEKASTEVEKKKVGSNSNRFDSSSSSNHRSQSDSQETSTRRSRSRRRRNLPPASPLILASSSC